MIAAVEYNSSTAWPGLICDVIYISGNPFMYIPPWAPYPDLYSGKFSSKYEIELSTSEDHVKYITGSEPFCHYIEYFIDKLYDTIHCPIRIDTDGAYPFRLMKLLQTSHISHVGLRLWYPPERYRLFRAFPVDAIKESIKIVQQFPSSEILIPYDPNYSTMETIEYALSAIDNIVIKILSPHTERCGTIYGIHDSYNLADEIAKLTSIVKNMASKSQNIEVI